MLRARWVTLRASWVPQEVAESHSSATPVLSPLYSPQRPEKLADILYGSVDVVFCKLEAFRREKKYRAADMFRAMKVRLTPNHNF
jgi:hypothetical protein